VIKKIILFLFFVNFIALLVIYLVNSGALRQFQSDGKTPKEEFVEGPVTVQLRNRPFTVYEYPAAKSPPLAVVLFGSGDGGWSGWEDNVSHALQSKGFTVLGINSADYAKTDYDLATLQADDNTIAQSVLSKYSVPPPLIVGGWSMGAAQAIAVAGGPNPPRGIVGLLIASALSRGRYGLRVSDQADILPTGPGTFAVADFTPGLNGLRIVQWHGAGDTIDSTAWLANLRTPHREMDFPNADHYFNGPNPYFVRQFAESALWILNSSL
jgi:hypothetical protein